MLAMNRVPAHHVTTYLNNLLRGLAGVLALCKYICSHMYTHMDTEEIVTHKLIAVFHRSDT